MKALLLDDTHPFLEEALIQGGLELIKDYTRPLLDFPVSYFECTVLVIRSRMPINAKFLSQFPHLKVIGRMGAGLENIDLSQAKLQGITCIRVPEGNSRAVAEHALAMLLSALNHLPRAGVEVRKGIWLREENKGREIHALKVGIIGYGVMGAEFSRLLYAMGVQVYTYDKYRFDYTEGTMIECSLEQLQAEVDVVSIHLPYNNETHYFADEVFFNGFAKPVHFINTARGQITNTTALLAALESGLVLSAGLDVLEYESSSFTSLFDAELPIALSALLLLDNVIITPHIAGWTQESFEKMGRDLGAKILAALKTV